MADLKSDDKIEEKNSINSLERRNSKKFDFDVDILKQKRNDRTLDITDRIEKTLNKHKERLSLKGLQAMFAKSETFFLSINVSSSTSLTNSETL